MSCPSFFSPTLDCHPPPSVLDVARWRVAYDTYITTIYDAARDDEGRVALYILHSEERRKRPPELVRTIGRGITGEAPGRGSPMVLERRHRDGNGRREHEGARSGAAGWKMPQQKWRLAFRVELDH